MFDSPAICEDVAEKLSNPNRVNQIAFHKAYSKKYQAEYWNDWTLGEGMAGLAYFYFMMEEAFPDRNWRQIGFDYLERALLSMQSRQITHYGLYQGLAGLGFVVSSVCPREDRFKDFLAKLDHALVSQVEKCFLSKQSLYQDESQFIPPSFYNLQDGLAGIIIYFLSRREDNYLRKLNYECLDLLARLLIKEKADEKGMLPAWFTCYEHLSTLELKENFSGGAFFLNHLHGITGSLSALSLALIEGCETPSLHIAIHRIANWLVTIHEFFGLSPSFPTAFSHENKDPLSSKESLQNTWIGGWPAIMRSIYLAGKALQDTSLIVFAEKSYSKLFLDIEATAQNNDPSFSLGLSGLLVTSSLMFESFKSSQIIQKLNHLENQLKQLYHPNLPFGFSTSFLADSSELRSVHLPGLLHGASGVGLSILLLHKKIPASLARIFLLT